MSNIINPVVTAGLNALGLTLNDWNGMSETGKGRVLTAGADARALLNGMAADDDFTGDEPAEEHDLTATVDETPVPDVNASKDDFAKGTWQHTVQQASVLFKRSGDAKKRASTMLWQGATSAIGEWESKSDTDVNGENLAADLLLIMGTARKGDVSKIKTVALAVKNNALDTGQFPNLSKAYAEAIRLTKTAKVEAEEDTAGVEAVEAVAAEAPKTATTAESAAKMLIALAGDFDEVAKVLLDVINHGGAENHEAHRSLLRSLAQEVSGRAKPAKPAPSADADEDKAGAAKATSQAKAPAAKRAPSKPKPSAASARQSDPTKKALPPKPGKPSTEARTEESGDLYAEVDAESAPAPAPAKKATAPKPRRA